MGRLFDGAAALLGLCHDAHHEGEAAMRLEAIAERSPQAERLPMVRSMLQHLEKHQAAPAARRCRLKSFPTTMQKRDCCGPSTMDLILRYWQGSEKTILAYEYMQHETGGFQKTWELWPREEQKTRPLPCRRTQLMAKSLSAKRSGRK